MNEARREEDLSTFGSKFDKMQDNIMCLQAEQQANVYLIIKYNERQQNLIT